MIRLRPEELLLKYNQQLPRYTSYPPAPYFNQNPDAAGALDMVKDSNHVGPRNASFYFHIPFCPKRCHFCGCHTEIGRPGAAIREYLETLLKETDLLLSHLDPKRPVTQIHFGGGTPNAAPFSYLQALLERIWTRMAVEPDAEIAIECDPNLITVDRIRELGEMGFTRISFGIQDFNLRVLDAVNRRFPKTEPKELFRVCRDLGLKGNNLDLIYGLPYQTQESFRETVYRAIDAAPDRISLFPYAHVPWIKGHQSNLDKLPMPDAATRLAIAWESRETLERAGYQAIGMDHFAKRDDELAVAEREGNLHRNFQGYGTAGRAGQVYALGSSAITQLHQGFIQNTKDLATYRTQVLGGKLPWSGAYRMRPEDIAIRAIINGILCAGESDPEAALLEAGVDPEWGTRYLAESRARLATCLEDGLVSLEGGLVKLIGNGQYVSRAVAAAFDPLLTQKPEASDAPRYSKAI